VGCDGVQVWLCVALFHVLVGCVVWCCDMSDGVMPWYESWCYVSHGMAWYGMVWRGMTYHGALRGVGI